MNNIIPIVHCFDNNYVIPAAVAFYSMLEYSDPLYQYNLYVLHSDITIENQNKLKETISPFKNASLEFIYIDNKFHDLFEKTYSKSHFSKEIYYKFLPSSMFPQFDKIIMTDVDVVYLNDISKDFVQFNDYNDFYIAGFKGPILRNSWLDNFCKTYEKYFTQEEILKLETGAGYYIFNLKKMREDNIEEKLIEYTINNSWRIIQPEQDVINLICYPKIKILPINSVVCTYIYDLYISDEDFNNDLYYNGSEIKFAMNNPIQLHYAGVNKPWNNPSCTKSEHWFKYLINTPFFYEQMKLFIVKSSSELKPVVQDFPSIPFKEKLKFVLKHIIKKLQ